MSVAGHAVRLQASSVFNNHIIIFAVIRVGMDEDCKESSLYTPPSCHKNPSFH